MIFALKHPAMLLGLLLGFVVGVSLTAMAQRWVLQPRGLHRGRLSAVGSRGFGRPRLGWAAYLDPYGAVAAVMSGTGWGARVDGRRKRHGDVLVLAAALVVHAALRGAGLAAYVAAGGDLPGLDGLQISDVLHGEFDIGAGRDITLAFALVNLACGVLALVPIPPLEMGVIVWSRLPKSPGARRVAYRALEEPWGVVVVLLLLLPLFGGTAPLLAVVNAVGDGLFGLF